MIIIFILVKWIVKKPTIEVQLVYFINVILINTNSQQ